MKNLSRILFYLTLCVLLTACGQSISNPTPTLSPVPTVTPSPSVTSTPTIEPTSSRIPTQTARPIIEEAQIAKLLETSFSIEALKALNGYAMRKITGWEYGFQDYSGGGFKNGPSYQWLDANHLLMRPITGDASTAPIPYSKTSPAVINLNSSKVWIPSNGEHTDYYDSPYWSESLSILISARENDIFVYSPDGDLISTYTGGLVGISPSGTKILFADDIWMDLSNGKHVDFGWDTYSEKYNIEMRGPIIWSENEARVFKCCYVYGDANTGESYGISGEDVLIDGEPVRGYLNATLGAWVGNNYVLPQQGWADTAPIDSIGFIPLFDPSSRTFRKLVDFLGLPAEFNTRYVYISISPNWDYMWLTRPTYPTGYLVNLKTRDSQLHTSVSWSPHGKYMFIDSQILTLSNNEVRTPPKPPGLIQKYSVTSSWHPTKEVIASISADEQKKQTLFLFDVESLSYQMLNLPSEFYETDSDATKIIWSPNGDRMVLVTGDGSLWQLDYPNLQNLDQLTPSMPKVKDIFWSPDCTYISFVSDKDIYIVDANINP